MYTVEEFDNLKQKMLRYILYKKRTEKEVRRKFEEYESNILEDVIEYLKEQKYIDDYNYIERAVNEYFAINNLSIKEIKYKLYSKGIDRNLIDEYVCSNIDSFEEYELKSAIKILNKKKDRYTVDEVVLVLRKKGYLDKTIKKIMEEELYETGTFTREQ